MLSKKFSLQGLRESFSGRHTPRATNVTTSGFSSTRYFDIRPRSSIIFNDDQAPPSPEPSFIMPPSETVHIRHPSFEGRPLLEKLSTDPLLETPHALFFRAAKKYSKNRCLAYRKITAYVTEVVKLEKGTGVGDDILIKDHFTNKEKVMAGEWEYKTYEEVAEGIRNLAAALAENVDGRLHMFARNSAWWLMLSQAASMSSTPMVMVYPTVGEPILLETLRQTKPVAVFVDSDLLPTLLAVLIDCPSIETILYHPVSTAWKDLETMNEDLNNLRNAYPEISVTSVGAFMGSGKIKPDYPTVRTKNPNIHLDIKDVVWGIMYPLGDGTQKPKGVSVTCSNIVANIASMKHLLKASTRSDDTYLSYLPLCFMLEYTLVSTFMISGLTVGFATKSAAYLLPSPFSDLNYHSPGDIESFAPSILFGIPPWWDEVHGHVLSIVLENEQPWQDAFWKAVARKKAWLDHPIGIISNAAIATIDNTSWVKTVRQRLFGSRVRWIGVSCSMLRPEKKEFLGLVMSYGGRMVEGFSFMEMSTVVTFTPPNHFNIRTLGFPLPSLEIKLVTVSPNFSATSVPARGEIYIRGPSVPKSGYPEASDPAFLDDGWVKTGTIGEWNLGNPGLSIIDRIKPLKERFMGEYVPIGVLERAYEDSNVVKECCLIYSARKAQPIAIVCTSIPHLRDLVDHHLPKETPGMASDGLLLSVRVKAILLKELNIVAKEWGCVDFELIGGIIMTRSTLPRLAKLESDGASSDKESLGELDREAIAMLFAEEIEVNSWIPISEPGRELIQMGSMRPCDNSLPPPPTERWEGGIRWASECWL